MSKVLRCGDIMPGCDTVIRGKTEEEVYAKAEEHVHKEHNMHFILPSVMNQIEAAIKEQR
jgi:predicted small metal-binding protein